MAGRLVRDNAFLIAAAALPVLVVALFLLSTAIPRWTVPPPAYDVLLRTSDEDASDLVRLDLDVDALPLRERPMDLDRVSLARGRLRRALRLRLSAAARDGGEEREEDGQAVEGSHGARVGAAPSPCQPTSLQELRVGC